MSDLEVLIGKLDTELANAKAECTNSFQQHRAWLQETLEKNTKQLQYHTCAEPGRGEAGGGEG